MAWNLSDGRTVLVMSNSRAYWIFDLEKKPFDWAGNLVAFGIPLLGVLTLAFTFYFGMMMGRKKKKGTPGNGADTIPGADFDVLFRLQQELEDAYHSVVGRTKGIERLVWLLDAYITDQGVNEDLEQRIRQVMVDFQEEVKPRLFRLLHLAEQASFETGTVADVNQALFTLSGRVDELMEKDLSLELVRSMRADLNSDWKCIKEGFFLLRSVSNKYFTTDPVRLIQGMLLVREGDYQRDNIHTAINIAENAPGLMSCRIDNGDLRFVMDNLLDNALRAMKDSPIRKLTVDISRTGKEVRLQIVDTGRGIDTAQQKEIFSSRFSSRRGGGRGLHRSREILARWGSEILMTESQSGKGTTFVVKLLAAAEEAGQKTMEAQG